MAPALYKRQSLPVYGTKLTLQLSHILQEDSLKVTELRGFPLPYRKKDIEDCMKGDIAVDYLKPRNVHKGVRMEFHDAGHIPGSSSILLELEGKRVLYTGDINNKDTRLLKGAEVPECDIIVLESTYGDRLHPNRKDSEGDLIKAISDTVDNDGVALLPVFSVGRSQEILMVLEDLNVPIYLDGLARLASKIIVGNGQFVRDLDALERAVNNSVWIEHDRQRSEVVSEPCVILTTAGMLNGGPVVQYLRMLGGSSRNSVLLTGYQVEGTNGRMLVETGHVVDPDSNRKVRIQANVRQFDFSAHADQNGLLEIVERAGPEDVILTHGSPQSIKALKDKLESKGGFKVHAPVLGDRLDI
jgi:putative mRNA 3-end processing factor